MLVSIKNLQCNDLTVLSAGKWLNVKLLSVAGKFVKACIFNAHNELWKIYLYANHNLEDMFHIFLRTYQWPLVWRLIQFWGTYWRLLCLKAHEFGVEKEEEPELELSADEQAVVEKVTKAANKYYIQAAWYLVVSFPHPLTLSEWGGEPVQVLGWCPRCVQDEILSAWHLWSCILKNWWWCHCCCFCCRCFCYCCCSSPWSSADLIGAWHLVWHPEELCWERDRLLRSRRRIHGRCSAYWGGLWSTKMAIKDVDKEYHAIDDSIHCPHCLVHASCSAY